MHALLRRVAAAEDRLRRECDGAGGFVTIDAMSTLGDRKRNLLGWYETMGYTPLGALAPAWWTIVIQPDW